MLEAYPPQSPGRLFGLGLIVLLILLDVVFLSLLISLPITLFSFFLGLLILLSLPAILIVTFLTSSLSRARFRVEDHVLIIEWGHLSQFIGYGQIQNLYLGSEILEVNHFRGIRWPGLMFGRGEVLTETRDPQPTVFYATRPLSQQLLISTGSAAFGITPSDPEEFKASLEALWPGDDVDQLPMELSSDLSFLDWDIWRDRVLQVSLGLAIFLNGLLFAFLSAILGRLPAEMALHFDKDAQVDRYGSPAGLLISPLVGFIAWIAACILGWLFYQERREKPIAYIIGGATVVIEIATWIAVIGLLANI